MRIRRDAFDSALGILKSHVEFEESSEDFVDQFGGRDFDSVRCAYGNDGLLWYCKPTIYMPGDLAGTDDVRGDPDFNPQRAASGFNRHPHNLQPLEKQISAESFEELFGSAVTEYLRLRVTRSNDAFLTCERASLLGLTEALRLQQDDCETEERNEDAPSDTPIPMSVSADRVFFYDGNASDLPLGVDESILQKDCFYASSLLERIFDGPRRPPQWHLVYLYTLRRCNNNEEVSQTTHVSVIGSGNDTIVQLNSESDHEYLDKMFEWCLGHPNKVFRSDSPYSRPVSSLIAPYILPGNSIFCRSMAFDCAKASVVNAISLMGTKSWALYIAQSTPPARIRFLKDLGKWVQDKVRIFSLRKLRVYPVLQPDDHVAASWLVSNSKGVYVVNLVGYNGYNHMVVVDTRREGDKKIYDPAEKYPVRLCMRALECCVDDSCGLLQVFAREFVAQSNADAVMNGSRPLMSNNRRKRRRVSKQNKGFGGHRN